MEKKIVIIGSGPAGLVCALDCCGNGIEPDDILIIERENELGGTLNQCIHTGFGASILEREDVTGTELASTLVGGVRQLGIECFTSTTVLSITKDKIITVISPKHGYTTVKADALVLALGCREKAKNALAIGGTRPAGVLPAGAAQRYINVEGYLPGKKTVILGSDDLALVVARRLTLEGGNVLCVCEPKEYSDGNEANIRECLEYFDIPLRYSHTVTRIFGKERIEAVEISRTDRRARAIKGSEEKVECDSLVFMCGLVPDSSLAKNAGIRIDPRTRGAYVNQYFETSADGIFTCGNSVRIHDLVDFIIEEGQIVGKSVKRYLDSKHKAPERSIKIKNGAGILYSVPQRLDVFDATIEECTVYFRVNGKIDDVTIVINGSNGELFRRSKGRMTSMQTGKISLDSNLIEKILSEKEITVSVLAEEK